MTDVLYRYVETHYAPPADEFGDIGRGPGSVDVSLREYSILRRTPRGCWISLDWWRPGESGNISLASTSGERFVLTSARKRFVCPTEAEARTSFVARKKAQIRIHKACIERAARALSAFERLTASEAA